MQPIVGTNICRAAAIATIGRVSGGFRQRRKQLRKTERAEQAEQSTDRRQRDAFLRYETRHLSLARA
jgi:hypothetical protein